jgi:MFS family permease
MNHCGYDFTASTLVIEWHVLGMFVPSFFTGHLIRRFGFTKMIIAGYGLMFICVAINLHGMTKTHFMIALILLGVGWNFMFITATHMVSETYNPAEKGKTQASNEFLIFSMVTLSALASGWLESTLGWQLINIMVVPLLALTFLVVLALHKQLRTNHVHLDKRLK